MKKNNVQDYNIMFVEISHYETDPEEVAVHFQDDSGGCISLGKNQPWVHLNFDCLRDLKNQLDRYFED